MKGQNPLLNHVFATAFLVAMVIGVVSMTTSLKEQYGAFVSEQEVQQVCSIIKSSIAKLDRGNNYLSLNSTVKGTVYAALPQRIADEPYRVRFIGRNASVETPTSNSTCVVGHDVTYSGSAPGGRIKIDWRELPGGTKLVEMSRA